MADHEADSTGTPRWVLILWGAAAVFALAFLIVHLAGGGFQHHGSTPEKPAAEQR